MKRSTLILAVAGGAFFAAAALASVVSLDLRQMLERADSAVIGTVTEKKTWEGTIANYPAALDFTTIVVDGEDLVSGKTIKREITYLGSDAKPVSEMPAEAETRVGTRALFFSVAMPGDWGGRQNQNSLVAAQNGVFHIEGGPKGDVVIGKGKGAAVDTNIFESELRKNVTDTLAKIRKDQKK